MNSVLAPPPPRSLTSPPTARYETRPGQSPLRFLRGRRGRSVTAALLAAELATVVVFALVYRPLDLSIYLWGGQAVSHGLSLYLIPVHGNWFTYPPFAAALFTPLAALPAWLVSLGWELASVAALAWACTATLRLAGVEPSVVLVSAMVAAGLLLEPVYHTLYLGQINLILLALVLADLGRVARGRPAGLGIGLAAAVKLTPALFIVLLLLTRRTRDALTAAGVFAACALAGFAADPAASRLYWTRLFYDTKRVGATYISNQSPYAALARILGGTSHVGPWYLVIALALGVAGLAIAVPLAGRGDWLGAAAVTGTTSLLVCPISWTHHWVWVVPALAVLARRGTPQALVAALCSYLLFALAPMWWTPWTFASSELGLHGLVTVTANCFLVAGIAFLAYMAALAWRPERHRPASHGPVASRPDPMSACPSSRLPRS